MKKKQVIKLNESKLRNMIRQIIRETIEPGSISSGTMRAEDLIPRFMSKLFKEKPELARSLWQKYPRLGEALCDKNAGIHSDWWESDEAQEILNNDIFDAMDNMSPEGHYFGSHPGDGSDYGYWPIEEGNNDEYIPDEDDLAYADEVDMNPDLMLGHLMKKHGMYESKLDGIIKESINKVLNKK